MIFENAISDHQRCHKLSSYVRRYPFLLPKYGIMPFFMVFVRFSKSAVIIRKFEDFNIVLRRSHIFNFRVYTVSLLLRTDRILPH